MLRDEDARPLECGDSSPLSLSRAWDASFQRHPPQQEKESDDKSSHSKGGKESDDKSSHSKTVNGEMKRGLTLLSLMLLLALSCSQDHRSAELVIRDFSFPWADKQAPGTEFRAHTADHHLQFLFVVEDTEVIVSEKWEGESTLDAEDRVELFFAKDEPLTEYWCLEIDPLGRVHDYRARHYRAFDSGWSCPGLAVTGKRTPTGYEVKGSIPLNTLSELLGREVGRGTALRIGVFRAEFFGSSRGEARDNWISWVRPSSPEPDFHIPSAFREWKIP